MNQPRALVIREVQLAYLLGFTEIEPFRRALKSGEVLAPSGTIAGKPIWRVADIERRYGADLLENPAGSEKNVLEAIEAM